MPAGQPMTALIEVVPRTLPRVNAWLLGATAVGATVSSANRASTIRPVTVSPADSGRAFGRPEDPAFTQGTTPDGAEGRIQAAMRAATPVTCGAAIDVPLEVAPALRSGPGCRRRTAGC